MWIIKILLFVSGKKRFTSIVFLIHCTLFGQFERKLIKWIFHMWRADGFMQYSLWPSVVSLISFHEFVQVKVRTPFLLGISTILRLSNLKPEDSAVYFCAKHLHTDSSKNKCLTKTYIMCLNKTSKERSKAPKTWGQNHWDNHDDKLTWSVTSIFSWY